MDHPPKAKIQCKFPVFTFQGSPTYNHELDGPIGMFVHQQLESFQQAINAIRLFHGPDRTYDEFVRFFRGLLNREFVAVHAERRNQDGFRSVLLRFPRHIRAGGTKIVGRCKILLQKPPVKRRPVREFVNVAAPNRNDIRMESDQSAKRSVATRVMRVNDGWPNVGYKLPNLPDSAKIVQLEG